MRVIIDVAQEEGKEVQQVIGVDENGNEYLIASATYSGETIDFKFTESIANGGLVMAGNVLETIFNGIKAREQEAE